MRFLFFLLLKLVEISIATVLIFTACVFPAFGLWVRRICAYGLLLLFLGGLVYFNWIGAGDWADKWRERKLNKKLARGRPPKH